MSSPNTKFSSYVFLALVGLFFTNPTLAANNSSRDLYRINNFEGNDNLQLHGDNVQLQLESTSRVAINGKEVKLEPGYLYLRRKLNATTYVLYQGKAKADAFTHLHALNIGTHTTSELIFAKLYRKSGKKPFEDELDVYFDDKGTYFEATPSLFLHSPDGKWVEFSPASKSMSTLQLNSHPDHINVYGSNGAQWGETPYVSGAIDGGLQFIRLEKEGYWPSVLPIDFSNNKTVQLTADLLIKTKAEAPKTDYKTFAISVDSSHLYLDSTELTLRAAIDQCSQKLNFLDSSFNLSYYQAMAKPTSIDSNLQYQYQEYYRAFLKYRQIAFDEFAKNWINTQADLEANLKLLSETREQKHKRLMDLWEEGKIKLSPTSNPESYRLELEIHGQNGWLVGTWDGQAIINESQIKTLQSIQNQNQSLKLLVQTEDFPISFTSPGGKREYRYYRLKTPEIKIGESEIQLAGRWSFEPAMMSIPEVARFTRADSMNAIDAMQKQLAEAEAAQVKSKQKQEADRLDLDKLVRGEVIEVAGGSFIFHGKEVVISPFAMNKTETTQEHYLRVTGKNPSSYLGPNKPVQNISWEKARKYCQSIGGDLPTEAQWEFAARAGTNTYYYWGDRQFQGQGISPEPWAVYNENSLKIDKLGPQDVGSKRPNPLGFYDIAGNVQEWVKDGYLWWYGTSLMSRKDPEGPSNLLADDHILKGGGWRSDKRDLEHAKTAHEDPRYWADDIGARCAFPSNQVFSSDTLKLMLNQFERKQDKNNPK